MAAPIEDELWLVLRRTNDRDSVRALEDVIVRVRLIRRRLEHAERLWREGRHVGVGHLLSATLELMGREEQ